MRGAGLAAVVEDLVDGELRLEVVQGVGAVERADVEVFGAELVLGQQRAEDEDRVIAAGERLGVIDLGKRAAAGLRDAGVGGVDARRRLRRWMDYRGARVGRPLATRAGFARAEAPPGAGRVAVSCLHQRRCRKTALVTVADTEAR